MPLTLSTITNSCQSGERRHVRGIVPRTATGDRHITCHQFRVASVIASPSGNTGTGPSRPSGGSFTTTPRAGRGPGFAFRGFTQYPGWWRLDASGKLRAWVFGAGNHSSVPPPPPGGVARQQPARPNHAGQAVLQVVGSSVGSGGRSFAVGSYWRTTPGAGAPARRLTGRQCLAERGAAVPRSRCRRDC